MQETQQSIINLTKYQDQAVFSESRFTAIISGIQGGKTFAGAVWSRMQYDQHQQDDGLICAPTYKILSQSTLPKFFEINKDLRKYYREGKGTIEVPGRGIIYIRSTENPNVIEGMTLRWIWADEAGQMKLQAWINIQGRVSILKGNVFITSTPYKINWLSTDFYEAWKKGNTDYKVVQFRSIDNPYFPKDEFERVRTTMDKRIFERRYCGLFTKMEGLVYEDFNYSAATTDKLPNKFDAVIGGVDWGWNAPAAIIIIGIKDNTFYIIDEFYQEKQSTEELAKIALRFKEDYNVQTFYCDSAEPDRIAIFNKAGLEAKGSNKDISFGVGKIQGLIKEGKFIVHPKCKFFLEEIEAYHYPEQKENREAKENPEKIDDHALDATRYAIVSYLSHNRITFIQIDDNRTMFNSALHVEPLPAIANGNTNQMTDAEKLEQIRKLDLEIIQEEERKRFNQGY